MTQSEVFHKIRDAICELPESEQAAIADCLGKLEMLRAQVGEVAFLSALAFVGAREAAK